MLFGSSRKPLAVLSRLEEDKVSEEDKVPENDFFFTRHPGILCQ